MPRRTSADKGTPVRVTIVTLDSHIAGAAERASRQLNADLPGLSLSLHAATEWSKDRDALERCREDVAKADIIIATMLFMEEHIQAILPALQARRDRCDAMICGMSAGEIIRLTRMGKFSMDGGQGGAISLLKRLRGDRKGKAAAGAGQMAMLRRVPQILRFIPGTAQDVRAYFLTLQYWLAASDKNIANLVGSLVNRYSAGPRAKLRGSLKPQPPIEYPDTGIYHPRLRGRISANTAKLPKPKKRSRGRVGLLVMRSYVLAGDTDHYDGVIGELEARGLEVVPAFSAGLDSRPAVERYFLDEGGATVDAVLSLTGFSLVGGPAYNDARAAEDLLDRLDVPYLAAHALEFQDLESWEQSERGLTPIEATMMVSIPEIDGATGPMVFGGRTTDGSGSQVREMKAHTERASVLARRVSRMIDLRRKSNARRKIAIVIFNFPPNGGSVGTAAHLAVFPSLFNTLRALKDDGYDVALPESADDLQDILLNGNAARLGADANVHARISTDDHVRREPWLSEIEAQWGPAPGRHQTDGRSINVLGAGFGNVFVGVQPAFGYEGDPMRLLFEKGFAPTHAFAAFYSYIKEDFGADAVLHFGTHGALEFMPGKQVGMSEDCWPDRLIGDLPNFYLYAANNPSEGTIAKRRSAATLISYLTPPITHAGLYKGLSELKASIDRWRSLPPDAGAERDQLAVLIQSQAALVELAEAEPAWGAQAEEAIEALNHRVLELEYTLIPSGLHVVGEAMSEKDRNDILSAQAEIHGDAQIDAEIVSKIVDGQDASAKSPDTQDLLDKLARANELLSEDHELPALLHALDGGFVRPVAGGDLLRNTEILPTGRNLHGFDPFKIPSAFAVADGERQADRLIARHMEDGNRLPETIAMVLWGTDNLKSEGEPISQALALIGARPRFDGFGRLVGAELIPLEELGRPRIDVVATLSGIFRDLLPLQTRMLAEAAYLAARADEPEEMNFVRKHALAHQREQECDIETAALRVFSNAQGAYGSNVNLLIDSGSWMDEDELGETFKARKCFAYGRTGEPEQQAELLGHVLSGVDLTYQNLESVELGVTTLDHYFDTLGGISKVVSRSRGENVPVYIGDQTVGEGTVRTLSEQVAIESRTRILNPKWYESMLDHGHEGVRHIESHVTNTLGWSATTGQVDPWVYDQVTDTFMLDDVMRERLAALNPTASARIANRLLEAGERQYWKPDEAVLDALRKAGDELEDRIEGVFGEEVAA